MILMKFFGCGVNDMKKALLLFWFLVLSLGFYFGDDILVLAIVTVTMAVAGLVGVVMIDNRENE